ncbi:Probable L-carnitine dehydratase [Mycobacteroides abscessus subsp. massiliense]|nr:Probable L-carnitine dehydratase [Mycobacteroides abscessus subsp. massiliense]
MHSGADIPSLYEWLSPALGPVSPGAVAPCTGPRHWWGGQLDVEGLALGSVQAALTAANIACTGERLSTDSRAVAAAFASLDHLRVDGRQPVGFAELSGFFRAADGWVRLHANYPHHARVLVETFGVDSKDALAEQILRLGADLIAERVTASGGLAVALRSPDQWRGGGAGKFVDTQPWIRFELGDTLVAPLVPGRRLSGVRVLDLTRVIAGPVATRFLALLGADVLRVDPPSNPELVDQYLDTGFGKRSAISDFADAAQRDRIEALLAEADVVISGYRPAALTRYGLDSAALRERFPALSVVTLDAWGIVAPGAIGGDLIRWCSQRSGSGSCMGKRITPEPGVPERFLSKPWITRPATAWRRPRLRCWPVDRKLGQALRICVWREPVISFWISREATESGKSSPLPGRASNRPLGLCLSLNPWRSPAGCD